MAIIYETKEDFEREKLRDQAKDTELRAEKQSGLGLTMGLGGAIIDQFNSRRENPSKGWSYAAVALSVVGLVEIVKSMFTRSKAHDLKLERDRMGPQIHINKEAMPMSEIVEMQIAVGEKPCSHCDHHKPKTLLEHAEKADVAQVRG